MAGGPSTRRTLLELGAAIVAVAVASAVRALLLTDLGTRIAYLTFYPAVAIAGLAGGLTAGLVATLLSALLCYFWIQQANLDAAGWMAFGVFLMSCSLISAVCEAMHRARARLQQRTAELALARDQAEAANRAKSTFLAAMSHELRTPLNAILGFSDLLRNASDVTSEQREVLEIINRSGEHLLNLINDVLDMAKIEAGRIALEPTVFDLGEMVRDFTDLMGIRARAKGLQLRVDQSSRFPRFVRADAGKLRQVVLNLLGNAIKFTAAGSVTMRLGTAPADAPERVLLALEVEDTGRGIAPGDLGRLFEPFVQVGEGALQKGTGLGLAITRQYAELMGGRVSVASEPGRGSTFRVTVPVGKVEASEVTQLAADAARRGRVVGVAPGSPAVRILIVEDQKENWLLLHRLLEQTGLQVRVVEDGAAAVEAFQSWQPHFIFMDCRMPVMDGLEATRRIRALETGRAVKIVAITASVFNDQRDLVLASGMDDFIRKPYRTEDIYECLERHLEVRFVREVAAVEGARPQSAAVGAMAALPSELRETLERAVVSLDAARIALSVDRVVGADPALGAALRRHVERLEYTAILQLVRAGAGPSSEGAV